MLGVLMPRTRAEVTEMLLTKRVQRERKYKKTHKTHADTRLVQRPTNMHRSVHVCVRELSTF